jgi:threonine aldolase
MIPVLSQSINKFSLCRNTTNKGGGACYELEDLQRIKQVCDANNLKFHLDGARIWNALVAKSIEGII